MRTALPALLVALLLTTAGCTGGFGESTPGDTATDTTATEPSEEATTRTQSATTETAADSLPPGVTTDGLADPDALVRAHADALDGQSVTFHERTVRRYGNGTLASRVNLTVRTAANRTRFLATAEHAGKPVYGASGGRVVTFGDEEGIYRKVETPNTSWTTVLRGPNGDRRDPEFLGLDAARSDGLYVLLNAFALNDSATVRNATAGSDANVDSGRYLVETSTVARPDLLASQLNVTAVRNSSLEMVVTEEGLIERYRVEFVGTDRGQEVRGATTLEYSALGETEVEAPAWSEDLKERVEENETTTG